MSRLLCYMRLVLHLAQTFYLTVRLLPLKIEQAESLHLGNL